jgi:hypothetical protein
MDVMDRTFGQTVSDLLAQSPAGSLVPREKVRDLITDNRPARYASVAARNRRLSGRVGSSNGRRGKEALRSAIASLEVSGWIRREGDAIRVLDPGALRAHADDEEYTRAQREKEAARRSIRY